MRTSRVDWSQEGCKVSGLGCKARLCVRSTDHKRRRFITACNAKVFLHMSVLDWSTFKKFQVSAIDDAMHESSPPTASHLFFFGLQSSHRRHLRPCSQMLAPPQSLQSVRRRWCSQKAAPPHSRQKYRCRLCSQMLPPWQSVQWLRWRWCSQMPPPPQSLQRLRMRWCSQMPRPPPRIISSNSYPPHAETCQGCEHAPGEGILSPQALLDASSDWGAL
jgi:hypothetical protein